MVTLRGTDFKLLLLDSKVYYQTDTVVLPKGVVLRGCGKYDRWGLNNTGSIIRTYGTGVARRWTDIDGADPADDTPQIVAGGNAVQLEDIALITEAPNAWSSGFFVAGVRQCGYRNLQAFGQTDACLYLDATWSSSNSILTALHSNVESDNGPLEFTGIGHFFRGGGTSGFAVKIQGTTRPYTTTPWVWAPGGASDFKIAYGRLGSDASGGGGAISIDGQMPSSAYTYIQGFTFEGCDLRISSGRYQARFDRANRVVLTNCYGEVSSTGSGEFAITSRTQAGLDGIILFGDKLNSGSVTIDGVPVAGTGMDLIAWSATRCVTRYRSDGRIFTPNVDASTSNRSLALTSWESQGAIEFRKDDRSSQATFATLTEAQFRATADQAFNLGSSNFRFAVSYVATRRWAAPGVVADLAGTGSPEGNVPAGVGSTYRCIDAGPGPKFFVKESGTGNSGWAGK